MKIGLLSDTHSYLDEDILEVLKPCDEIWHAGDIGNLEVLDRLQTIAPVRAVFGNIDNATIRSAIPKVQNFHLAEAHILMIHIGAYPPHYNTKIKALLDQIQPDIFVCGHSHILKVIYDKERSILHLNPGACGRHGFHKVRTLLRFELNKGTTQKMEVIEINPR